MEANTFKTAGSRQLKIPVFFMEEHLSKEQLRLEAEETNVKHFMREDYEQARRKFDKAGTSD